MKSQLIISALLLATPALFVACEDQQVTYGKSHEESSYDQREEFRAKMERAIDELEARLERLREEAIQQGEQAKEGTQELIEEVRQGLANLRQDLAKAGEATLETWDDFRDEVSDTFDDLRRKLDQI